MSDPWLVESKDMKPSDTEGQVLWKVAEMDVNEGAVPNLKEVTP